ncbi:hypothetical protein GLAREA_08482 [Glarea lozoyensis ATCC 20868]|uniref:Uncharacterized protein n=1 Tax=Glarea lozoyensis (strain ATCC 20868 / MF5171) TaxID=1116229 RepID=S3CH55_GLAL2|nr:uncharacterized protein GLAREA_08482 [Glarea lozoyensis ATCC 20868]EPE24629.1 hypothetical protein GLAREA_08482 [Glarea lozoyensis ATCC 20868]
MAEPTECRIQDKHTILKLNLGQLKVNWTVIDDGKSTLNKQSSIGKGLQNQNIGTVIDLEKATHATSTGAVSGNSEIATVIDTGKTVPKTSTGTVFRTLDIAPVTKLSIENVSKVPDDTAQESTEETAPASEYSKANVSALLNSVAVKDTNEMDDAAELSDSNENNPRKRKAYALMELEAMTKSRKQTFTSSPHTPNTTDENMNQKITEGTFRRNNSHTPS